jgi:hypothetical protein
MLFPTVLLPLFVQVGLTFFLLLWMGGARFGALRRGAVRPGDITLREPNWPARSTQIANAFQNQLELPVLFYVAVLIALIARRADYLFVILEWLFVLSRLVHAAIHVGPNTLRLRAGVFAIGAIVLLVMWVLLALHVLFGL